MSDLDEDLKAFYAQKTLSDEQAETMLSVAKNRQSRRALPRWPWAALFVVGFFLFIGLSTLRTRQAGELSNQVAEEVAYNFFKNSPLSLETTSITELALHLDQLAFDISPAGSDLLARSTLVGGRYCSILGNRAAQLQFLDQGGHRQMVYVTLLNDELNSVRDGSYEVDGAQVEVWKNKGRLLARVCP